MNRNYQLDARERLSYAASLVLVADSLHATDDELWVPVQAMASRAVNLELIRMELAGIDEQITEVLAHATTAVAGAEARHE